MDKREREIQKKFNRSILWLSLVDFAVVLGGTALSVCGRRLENSTFQLLGLLLMAASLGAYMFFIRRLAAQRTAALEALKQPAEPGGPGGPESVSVEGMKPDWLLVMGYPSDTLYQLLPGREQFHFVRLGWGFLGDKSYDRMLLPGMSDGYIRSEMEKGFSVDFSAVESLHITFKRCVSTDQDNVGIFELHTGGQRKRFIILRREGYADSPAAIQGFFEPVSAVLTADEERYQQELADQQALEEDMARRAERRDPEKVKQFKFVPYVLCGLSLIVGLFWRVGGAPYNLFAWAAVILGIAPVLLVCLFPSYFSVGQALTRRRGEKSPLPDTVDLFFPILVCNYFPILGAAADFNILDWRRLVVYLVLAGVAAALLMTRGIHIRGIWWMRLLLVLVAGAFSMGPIVEVNYLLDYGAVEHQGAILQNKHIVTGKMTFYDLDFDELEEPVHVPKDVYDSVEPGDTMVIITFPGALRLPYVEVWTLQEWRAWSSG